jgi:hypothetical protein
MPQEEEVVALAKESSRKFMVLTITMGFARNS